MRWVSTTADEHVLCDDRGGITEYRVRRDPVNGLYAAIDGELVVMQRLSLAPCQHACMQRYEAERNEGRASKAWHEDKRGRYTKRA